MQAHTLNGGSRLYHRISPLFLTAIYDLYCFKVLKPVASVLPAVMNNE